MPNTINFNQVADENNKFDALPEGLYNVRAEAVELKTAASTGNEMISVTFVVIDEKYKNRKVWHNFVLTPKAFSFIYNYLKLVDSKLINKTDATYQDIIHDMLNTTVAVYLESGITQNGNPTNKIKRFQKVTSTVPMSAPAAQKSNAMFS